MARQVQDTAQHDIPPPPYSEREDERVPFQIRRKPISTEKTDSKNDVSHALTTSISQATHLEEQILATQAALPRDALNVSLSTQSSVPGQTMIAEGNLVASPQSTSSGGFPSLQSSTFSSSTNPSSVSGTTIGNTTTDTGGWKKTAAGHAQKALQEAKHFVGGLIEHPSVSNKHYTILRHSHGIVFYQGSNTFLTVSIFVDEPLPKDRTIWMQCKGWSGKTGMRTKAFFGLNDGWINVTPTLAINPDQVNASDERAWQRDIKRFRKKASGTPLEKHVLRETVIARVPVETTDGYYQLVLCRGDQKRKVLCTSPVFRVISTTSDPSTLRGASLSTLPVELGLWIGSLYASNTASTIISPVTSRIQTVTQSIMPSTTQTALQTAYSVSGLQDRVDSRIDDASDYYSETENQVFSRLGPTTDANIETGPVPPYPVDFVAHMNVQAVTSSFDAHGLPERISITKIAQLILPRLNGYYFAWCQILSSDFMKKGTTSDGKGETEQSWLQCIVSASSVVFQERVSNVRSQRALKVTSSIRIIEDIDISPSSQVRIRIMGFIRPSQATRAVVNTLNFEAEEEERIVTEICDIEFTRSTLDHPAWQPHSLAGGIRSQRSITGSEKETQSGIWDKAKDGYTNVRLKSQTMVGQIPFHRVGIRMSTDQMKDKNLAVAGYYIPR